MFFVSKFNSNSFAKPKFSSILSLLNKTKKSEKSSQTPRLELELEAESDYAKARELCQAWGKTATSFMTLNNQNRFFFDVEQKAYIAFRLHLKVAITIGDPIGPAEQIEPCIRQFSRMCKERGWIPAFFAIEDNLNVYQALGFKRLQVAEETYLGVAELTFKGKSNQDVRTALNRASREEIKFCLFEPEQTFSHVYMQMKKISNDWLQHKGLPELRFMLGSVETVTDPEIRTYYAQDKHGEVHGYVSWLPCYSVEGWTLDLMRRNKDALPGIMEFLIARSVLQFQLEGVKRIALGAAPLAPIQNLRKTSKLERLLYNRFRPLLDRFYSFSNLFHFKRKFKPDWKPLYLVYPRNLDLARVTLALLVTYLRDGSKTSEI